MTDRPLTLAESSRLLGEAIWCEERLFEVLGGQVVSDLPATTRVALAELSRRHAWRADQLRSRLPEVPGFTADDVVGPPSTVVDPTTWTVASVYDEVVPALDAHYLDMLDRCSPWSDAAVARTVQITLADLRSDVKRAGVDVSHIEL